MAVVFISPKQRQKMFFTGITALLLLFLAAVSLMVFLSGPKQVSQELIFNKPKVSINMAIFDSEQFKALQPFDEMEKQYTFLYTIGDDTIKRTGSDSAKSIKELEDKLKDKGWSVYDVKEVVMGRINPFIPYYESISGPATKTKSVSNK